MSRGAIRGPNFGSWPRVCSSRTTRPRLRPEWLEQLQHLLVAAPGPTGHVTHHDVLDVEVANLHLVGVAVGDHQGLGDSPRAHADVTLEDGCRHSRRLAGRRLDRGEVTRHPAQDIGPPLLQMQFVKGPVGRRRHLLRIRRQQQAGARSRRRIAVGPPQAAHRRCGFAPGHLLTHDRRHQRIEHQAGTAKSHPGVPVVEV